MYRNQYDTDCATWSTDGRLFQVEYAMKAIKHGTCVVALRSKTHAVLVGLRRVASDLAYPTNKLMKIDNHVGLSMAGLTADARAIATFMRDECQQHRYVYDSAIPLNTLLSIVGDRSQSNTISMGTRPFGVGLLVVGVDSKGPHVYETCPTGNCYEYTGIAIGARAQSAKTHLEKFHEQLEDMSLDDLITTGLKALLASQKNTETKVDSSTVSVGIVGINQDWKELTEVELHQIFNERINAIEEEQ